MSKSSSAHATSVITAMKVRSVVVGLVLASAAAAASVLGAPPALRP